jgi:hypothetical protein
MMKERAKDSQYDNSNNSGLNRVTTLSKHFKGLLDLTCNFIFLQTSAEIILQCLITTNVREAADELNTAYNDRGRNAIALC